ncbi:MAG: hypothetical protein JOZ86_15630 [Candidatus Eremiobacteraeota bacterium]|nr:hypothetical protein [Candidatus Eremiobacteraeota bacterium]
MIARTILAVVLTLAVSVPAQAEPVPAHAPSATPQPCGSPGTAPRPQIVLDGVSRDGNTTTIALTTDATDVRFLREIEFVPDQGSVITLPASKGRRTAPNRVAFEVPNGALPVSRQWRIVVATDDLAAPPNCPIVFKTSLGPLNADGGSRASCRLDPSIEQQFRIIAPASNGSKAGSGRELILAALPGGVRDVREGYRYMLELPGREAVVIVPDGPVSSEELQHRFGPFEAHPNEQLWLLQVPALRDERTDGTLVARHREYGLDDAGARCAVDKRIVLFAIDAAQP